VWPEIARLAKLEIDKLQMQDASTSRKKIVVLEAAVLIEAGWQALVDQIWVTSVPPETAKERLMKRNNFSAEEALKRINSQMSDAERCKHGSVIIDNGANLESALSHVNSEWQKLVSSSS
jgi:dephospho-CoA kinase